MHNIQHCKLVAKKSGLYTIYVFELDTGQYIMCTQLPNWGIYNINIGDTGFLEWEEVYQGDKYIDRKTGQEATYKFTNNHFKEFIKDNLNTEEQITL